MADIVVRRESNAHGMNEKFIAGGGGSGVGVGGEGKELLNHSPLLTFICS